MRPANRHAPSCSSGSISPMTGCCASRCCGSPPTSTFWCWRCIISSPMVGRSACWCGRSRRCTPPSRRAGPRLAGRTRAEPEGRTAFFITLLALRTRLDGAASFRSVLHGVKAAALDAYAHQDLPFEKLVEALHPVRDLSREPIVQAVFALQNMPQQPTRIAGLTVEPFDTGPVPAKFDLQLSTFAA